MNANDKEKITYLRGEGLGYKAIISEAVEKDPLYA